MFRKRRFFLRHAVLSTSALIVFCGSVAFFGNSQSTGQPADPVKVSSKIAATESFIPQPNTILPDEGNMKAAFETKPSAPSYEYAGIPSRKPGMTQKLVSLQSSISSLLQAGSELLVSKKQLAIGKGDTLMELLIKNKVPAAEAHEAIAALRKFYDPRDLRPNHEITVFFHQDPAIADPKFSGLRIKRDTVNTVVLNKTEDGGFTAENEEKEVHRTMQGFSGTIDGSLYMAAKAQGLPDGVILDLIKMYSWNVDFQRDIQKGDRFEVMYEDFVTDDGDAAPGKGDIIFAKLTLDGREYPFYRFKDKDGDTDYFDDTGHSAKKSLMKTPIDGARLSSGFGMRRHPVLGYSKMHKGIDFAAARGTPIYAAGDGVIKKMGPFSSYGNYVRIKHRNGLETAYAHMKGFKAGLKSGSRVKQGQIIGYVGTTGRSTGPHLHYEVMVGGKAVNPKSIKLPTGKALAGKDLSKFKAQVAQLDRQFKDLGSGTALADASPLRKTSRN